MDKAEFFKEAKPGSLGPLEGVRVLEATNYASGPVCGMILCDLGAESIKCEMPGKGDPNRMVPPFASDRGDLESSVVFSGINRGKRGVTLDFRKPEGQELFRRLAATADVLIENFSPGTMDRWGLGYEEIRKVKPDIVYVSISGFGQFGPWSYKKGFDPVGQALGGLMSVTGEKDGPPLRAGFVIADDMAGWQAAIGALSALYHKAVTGEGQRVDANLVDSQLYASSFGIMAAANANHVWRRSGNAIGGGAPMSAYLCKDGEWLNLFAPFDPQWQALCRLMGREELIEDERTATWPARDKNAEFVDEQGAAWMRTVTCKEAEELLEKADIVAAPILGFDQIIEVEHYRERESVVEVEHPLNGPLTHFGVATKHSRTPGRIKKTAPLLGEENEAIFKGELGLSDEQFDRLKEARII